MAHLTRSLAVLSLLTVLVTCGLKVVRMRVATADVPISDGPGPTATVPLASSACCPPGLNGSPTAVLTKQDPAAMPARIGQGASTQILFARSLTPILVWTPEGATVTEHPVRTSRAHLVDLLRSRDSQLSKEAARELSRVLISESKLYGYNPLLGLAIAEVESNHRPLAVSTKGAHGIMQVCEGTGREVARELGIDWRGLDTLQSIEDNVRIGMRYLHSLEDRFNDRRLAIIAYKKGPSRLARELAGRNAGNADDRYLRRVLRTCIALSGSDSSPCDFSTRRAP